jgi:hypothetical protein
MSYEFLLILIACHFVGDFPFQGDWLGLNKGKSWELMAYHCIIYTSAFILFAKISLGFALLLLISHFVIDPLKARWHIIKHIWMDQLFHLGIILIGFKIFC